MTNHIKKQINKFKFKNSFKVTKYFLIIFTILSLFGGITTYLHPNLLNNNNKTAQALTADHTLTLTSAQQQIKGFGYSSVEMAYPNNGYRLLDQTQRAELDNPLLDELKMNTVRYWGDVDTFVRDYGQMYENVKNRTSYHLYQAFITDTNYQSESTRTAIGLKNLKNLGYGITHVSVCNECSFIPLGAWPQLVISLKQALVAQGLNDIKVVAPEGPNNDGFWLDRVKEIKNNPTAWAALDVISSHSYSMSMRPEDRDFKLSSGKEWWIGESSDNGSEEVGNSQMASITVARILHDFNQGVDNWIYFIGHALEDSGDNKTRIIKYSQNPFNSQKLEKFYYFKQFRSLFNNGSQIYNTISSTENEMPWTYNNYAKLQGTGAKNSDGSWSLAVTNVNSSNTESVKFKINEIGNNSDLVFDVYRNNGSQRGTLTDTVTMVNGEALIPGGVKPYELVTLKSRTSGTTTSTTSNPVTSTTSISTATSPTTSSTTTTSSLTSTCNGTSLTGTAFGASPSYADNPNVAFDKAFDDNTSTFFDYQNPNEGYVGLDLGANKATLNRVCVYPRGGVDGGNNPLYTRSNGAIIQGSNDNINYTNIVTLSGFADNQWKDVVVNNTTPYKYYKYLSPDGGYGNLAEIKFFGVVSSTSSTSSTSSSTAMTTSSTSSTATTSSSSNNSSTSINSDDCFI